MEINNCHSHLVCLLFTLWPFLLSCYISNVFYYLFAFIFYKSLMLIHPILSVDLRKNCHQGVALPCVLYLHPQLWLNIMYRIVGNVRGRKRSRFCKKKLNFMENMDESHTCKWVESPSGFVWIVSETSSMDSCMIQTCVRGTWMGSLIL